MEIAVTDPTAPGLPDLVVRIARGGLSVVIRGETGTGKEVLARSLHQLSGRSGPFVAVNCAAFSESLIESELFGHERGAFTGAVDRKLGLFELARGGTLFLDEIAELSIGVQAKLLRVLELRELYRLGGTAPIKLDVRVLSATHVDLWAAVESGRMRHDLWFRLNGITLAIPPLRERRSQIETLAVRLLGDGPRLEPSAVDVLLRHHWPGNVRELQTVLERARTVADGEPIAAEYILLDAPPPSHASPAAKVRLEVAAIQMRGNVTRIASALGTSRSQVRRMARRYSIELHLYR